MGLLALSCLKNYQNSVYFIAAMTYNHASILLSGYSPGGFYSKWTYKTPCKIAIHIDLQAICMGCPVLIHLEVNLSHHSNTAL